MSLQQIRHWVFDMDGTLTVAVHDFAAIKVALEIPQTHDILTHLAALPADEAAAKHAWLLEHERELAIGSRPATVPWSWSASWRRAVASWVSLPAMPGSLRISPLRQSAWPTALPSSTWSGVMKHHPSHTLAAC